MHGADERIGGQALTRRSGSRADRAERARIVGRTSGRGPRGADRRMGGRGVDVAEEAQTGPSRRGRAVRRMSGLSGWGFHCIDNGWGGRADGQTGRRVDWAVGGGRGVVERTSTRGSGPGFKRPHSMRPISLLGAQFACLVRARVCRVLGSAVGSKRIPRQTPVLSART